MSEKSGDGRIRVMIVSPGFPPTRGGVEEHVGRLAAELATRGVEVTVLTARRGLRRRPQVEYHRGCRVVVYPAWRTTRLSMSPRLLLAALRSARTEDLLHVHSYHALTGLAVLNRAYRGRVVFTPHFHGGGHSRLADVLHLGYRRLAARLFAAASAVVCVSRAERAALERAVPTVAARVIVIPNGVAVEEIGAAAPYPGHPRSVLTVGRLEDYKRVDRVVDAMVGLDPGVELVVVGDGPARAGLADRVARLGLTDRVRFVGAVETAELQRWLRTARVLVSASAHEAFGMAPLEAAAAGARVVVSDLPAHREIARDFLGPVARLVDPEDVAALTDAIAAQLAEARPGAVAVPSWSAVADQTLRVYLSVLGRSEVADPRSPTPQPAERSPA